MDAKDLRSFAADCLRVAADCQDAEMAAALRKLAAEYLDHADEIARPVGQLQHPPQMQAGQAAQPASQQQQQIQPDKTDDKPS